MRPSCRGIGAAACPFCFAAAIAAHEAAVASSLASHCRGDELNFVHVIERPVAPVEYHGAPPVDYLPQPSPVPHEQVVENAKQFLQARFGSKLQSLQPPPVVHLITVGVRTHAAINIGSTCSVH